MAPNSVVAKLHNQASYEEGEATADLQPGMGCVLYEDGGQKYVRPAEADEQTTRIVRENRNPPSAVGGEGDSPIGHAVAEGQHAETVGFNRHDQARCLIASGSEGDAVGFDGDGYLTTGGEGGTDAVARIREDLGDDLARVEFL